jgi:AraC-like DNA-binding protein
VIEDAAVKSAPPPWPPLLAARGALSQSATHAHHGMHVVIATRGSLSCRVHPETEFVESAGIITAPDVAHEIKTHGAEVLLVFIDPESRAGATLCAGFEGAARRITEQERGAIDTSLDPRAIMTGGGVAWTASVLEALGVEAPMRSATLHRSVRKALALVRDASPDAELSLSELAKNVGLSESRLMHAFTESVGIPLRPYLAWLRVQRAVVAIARGAPLSESAQHAGFADAPHMTRTFRKMLGLTPSEIQRAILASPFKTDAGA